MRETHPKIHVDTEQINATLDLVEFANRYTTLRQAGREYKGPCPKCGGDDRFHVRNEPNKWWQCRQCNPGGDAISFVMWVNDWSFLEAVEFIDPSAVGKDKTDLTPKQPICKPAPSKRASQPKPSKRWNHRRDKRIISVFDFETVEGVLVQHVKFPPRRLGGKNEWVWRHWADGDWYSGLGGNSPHLFDHLRLITAEVVWLVGGEKDAARGNLEAQKVGSQIVFTSHYGGENSKMKPRHIEQLRGKIVRISYDNDEAGRRGEAAIFDQLVAAGIEAHITKLPIEKIGGDLSDYFDGGASFDDLLNCEIVRSGGISVAVPTKQHLSDVPFTLPNRAIIHAATGIGKTHYALNHIDGKVVFAVPTQTLVQQISAEYPNCAVYYEHEKTAHADSQRIVCTYDSVPQVMQFVDIPITSLVIDEIHNTASSGGYRSRTLDDVLDTIEANWQRVTLLTGTPIPFSHPSLANFSVINVQSELREQTAQMVTWKDKKRDAIRKLCTPDKRHLVFLNNKGDGLDAITAMLHANGFTNDQIMALNADNKREPAQAHMIATGIVPDGINVLIVTSVAIEGINIYSDFDCIHVYDRLHPVLAQQLVNRLRNQSAHAYIYGNGDGKREMVNPQKWLDQTLTNANGLLERFQQFAHDPNDDSEDAEIGRFTMRLFLKSHANLIRIENDNEIGRFFDAKKYTLSYSGIDNAAFEAVERFVYKNPRAYQSMLVPYNWQFGEVISIGDEEIERVLETIDRKQLRAQRQAEHVERVAAVRMISPERAEIIAQRGSDEHDKKTVDAVRTVVGMTQSHNLSYETACDVLEASPAKRGRNRQLKRINIQRARAHGNEVVGAIYDSFAVGEVLTADEIHQRVRDILRDHNVLGWLVEVDERLTKTATTRLLKDFFVVKRTKVSRSGERVNALKIINDNPVSQLCYAKSLFTTEITETGCQR